MAPFMGGRALIIGLGAYQDANWHAAIAARDAKDVAAALKDPAGSAYPDQQILELYDGEATRKGVAARFRRLIEECKPTDTVAIFFCGHGLLGTDGVYYFATYDSVFTADNRLQAGTGVGGPELIAALRAIRAQKLLFIVNACFSGHVMPTLGAAQVLGAPPSASLGVEVLATGEGRALIAASRSSQPSYFMHEHEHTLFGQALIDGLRGKAERSSGGYVGLYELYEYVYANVKSAASTIGGAQEPVLTIIQGVGPFPVAHYPGAAQSNLGAPAIRQTPPPNTAVMEVPHATVQATGQASVAVNAQGGSRVTVDQSRKLIDFSGAQIEGGVKMGNVAGGNMTLIDIKVDAVAAATVDNKQELLALIGKLQQEVTSLQELPEGEREDIADELRKAREAGDKGNKPRMLEKLESAQKLILSIPAAIKIGETLAALLQRAIGM